MRFHIVLAGSLFLAPLQSRPQSFDVVSIKPNRSGAAASETETVPGRLNLINVTPLSLIMRAFASFCHPALLAQGLQEGNDLEAEARSLIRFLLRAITP